MTRTELLDAIAAGIEVVTVNNRLARQLLIDYENSQIADGRQLWPRPAIVPLKVWLRAQANQLGFEHRLLSPEQNQLLWEQIIAADFSIEAGGMLQIPATARQAVEAQSLLLRYRASLAGYPESEETRVFNRWSRKWQELADSRDWLVPDQLYEMLGQAFGQAELQVPVGLVLAGFDDESPALRHLTQQLSASGCTVGRWQQESVRAARTGQFCCQDPAEEADSCARWLRHHLQTQPEQRIGILAPQLEAYSSLLLHALQRELDPEGALKLGADSRVNLSLGTPLDQLGAVRTALELLGFRRQIELSSAGALLRSPHLGGSRSEALRRAEADRELRSKGQSVLPLRRLQTLLRKQKGIPVFVAMLEKLETFLGDTRERSPGLWAERFADLLQAVGWPGEGSQDSGEFQLVLRFKELLRQFAALDRCCSRFNRREAVARLRRLAAETVFQPEGDDQRIQVMGLLESAGQRFDRLWILGAHDGALPAAPQPNPFLPLGLQRQLQMPHADASRELAFARQICDRLVAAADEVIFSWPAGIDGAECQPTPLIADLLSLQPEMAASVDLRHLLQASGSLERCADAVGPPLPPGKSFRGGTGIIKDQALCPFRAFASYRLRTRGLDSADIGLDPRSRGSLVHAVLEQFWKTVQSRDALAEMGQDALQRTIAKAGQAGITQYEKEQRLDLPQQQRKLEQKRLQRILLQWLERELERGAFTVAELESGKVVAIGPLQIRTRADRVDRLADGSEVIIDYKTGKVDLKNWFDERLTEPQLPIYATGQTGTPVAGVLFARVHNRVAESGYRGVLQPEHIWSDRQAKEQQKVLRQGEIADLTELIEDWRVKLDRRGAEFVSGAAAVMPVDIQQACRYCDLLPLCRRLQAEPERGGDR